MQRLQILLLGVPEGLAEKLQEALGLKGGEDYTVTRITNGHVASTGDPPPQVLVVEIAPVVTLRASVEALELSGVSLVQPAESRDLHRERVEARTRLHGGRQNGTSPHVPKAHHLSNRRRTSSRGK
jgi:hypothetical protein